MHIDNLSKNQDIFLFRECYAMEKVDGTSAHIVYSPFKELIFSSGGASHDNFIKFFPPDLLSKFQAIFPQLTADSKVTVYGEAYGGKVQGMSATYGSSLKFIVFEVNVAGCWLSVPQSEDIAKQLNLEFVPYVKIPVTIEALTEERNKFSVVGEKNGNPNKKREGIVLRPLMEFTKNNGTRIIAKYKNEDFSERKSKSDTNLSPEQKEIMDNAEKIADEWVTAERMKHVLDKMPQDIDISATPEVIKAMVEDVVREGKDEFVDSKEARKAIGKKTVVIFKEFLKKRMEDNITKLGRT